MTSRSLDNLAVVRRSKLHVAQWIAAGITECPNATASRCLARYAAEQLESAVLIPVIRSRRGSAIRQSSLLQSQLRDRRTTNGADCVRILASVSQAILNILAIESGNQFQTPEIQTRLAQLIRRERRAAAFLDGIAIRRSAA